MTRDLNTAGVLYYGKCVNDVLVDNTDKAGLGIIATIRSWA